jgi:hypothetical protein
MKERCARHAAERAFRPPAGDALFDEAPAGRMGAAPSEPRPAAGRPAAPPIQALPDASMDYIVELTFPAPVAAGQLAALWKEHEYRYAKRALLASSADGRQWSRLVAADSEPVQELRAGLQLVSRDGTVSEAELIEFRAAVESVAAATGATVKAPEMRQAVDLARALDQFCADTDIQVVLHVTPPAGEVVHGSAVRRVAEEAGLVLEADGRFVLRGEDGGERFCLNGRDGSAATWAGFDSLQLTAVSLTLDVPRAPGGRGTFQAMASLAGGLAAAMNGSLVDDNGRPLDERSLAAIDAQLGAVLDALAGRGIEPGSAAALRLFA